MSIIYMKLLEKNPQNYEEKFDKITSGVSKEILDKILNHIKPNMKVLEIGCGPGRLSIAMANKGANVTAIDKLDSMITLAKERAGEIGLENKISFIQGDVREIDLPKEEFDVVISTFVLSELSKPTRKTYFAKVTNYLKKDGLLFLADEEQPTSKSKRFQFLLRRLYYFLRVQTQLGGLTHAFRDLGKETETHGFTITEKEHLGDGSVVFLQGKMKEIQPEPEIRSWKKELGKLRLFKIFICLLFGTFFLPWSVTPGIYRF